MPTFCRASVNRNHGFCQSSICFVQRAAILFSICVGGHFTVVPDVYFSCTKRRRVPDYGATKKLVLHVRLAGGSLSITTPVSLLVRSVLHGQVSLAAVNHMYVIHEAMNGCKNLEFHERIASKMLIFLNNLFIT